MDDLEQIMRKIHVLFSKCEAYGDDDDNKIIVPKKEVFRLLERLNLEVIRMMDRYEGTRESRERGLADQQRRSEKIVEDARDKAEDVYAGSMIYTDRLIDEINQVIEDAKEDLWEHYARMAKRLVEQKARLAENQEEIKRQLTSLSQGEKYVRLIERENERLRKLREAQEASEEQDEYDDDYDDYEDEDDFSDESNDGEDVAQNSESAEAVKGKQTASDDVADGEKSAVDTAEADSATADSEIAATGESGKATNGKPNGRKKKKRRIVPDLEAEWRAEEEQKPVRKVGSAVYQDISVGYGDEPVKHVAINVKVNENYVNAYGEDAPVDLDWEYEMWKAGEDPEQVLEEKKRQEAEEALKNRKSPKRRLFGKPKKK